VGGHVILERSAQLLREVARDYAEQLRRHVAA
jgi:hypothetical protein